MEGTVPTVPVALDPWSPGQDRSSSRESGLPRGADIWSRTLPSHMSVVMYELCADYPVLSLLGSFSGLIISGVVVMVRRIINLTHREAPATCFSHMTDVDF